MSNIPFHTHVRRAAFQTPKKGRSPLRVLGLAGALLIAAPFVSLLVPAAKAGPIACYALEQNCLAHAAKTRQFISALKSNVSLDSRPEALDSYCYDAHAKAASTGFWPALGAAPAIACVR